MSKLNIAPSEDLANRLNEWHVKLQQRKINEAKEIQESLRNEKKLPSENLQASVFYSLLEFRTLVEEKKFDEAKKIMTEIDQSADHFDRQLNYLYHFFKGIYEQEIHNIENAFKNYKKASEHIAKIDDPLTVAEFHYKLGGIYYLRHQSFYAIENIKRGLTYYEEINLDERIAGCELILGLCFTDIGEYSIAEESFHNALGLSKKINNKDLERMAFHNLGLFYSEQGMSEAAIRYLNKVINDDDYELLVKVSFLITREYLRLENYTQAEEWYLQGVKLSKDDKQEYFHKFMILKALHFKGIDEVNHIDEVFVKGIEYFKAHNQWINVSEYAEEIASYYASMEKFEEATKYYQESAKARRIKREMEILK